MWFYNNVWVATKPSRGSATVLNSQYQVSGDATLRISNVQTKDNGDFDCQVVFTSGVPPVIQDRAKLVVVVRPTITLKITTAPTLDEGATRTLFCVASGNPKPTYRWYKDNVKILEDQNNSNYTITSASRNDAGTYRCEAVINVPTLGQYSDSYTVQVTVRFRPVHKTNSLSSNQTVVEGRTATFLCLTEAFPTATAYKWFKDGIEITNSQDFETLKISNTQSRLRIKNAKKGSAGQYSCDGTNAVGTGDRKSAFLLVNYPPTITFYQRAFTVNETNDVTLTCRAKGVPQPTITWRKIEDELNCLGEHCIIRNISGKNDGTYRCVARNELGEDWKEITLNVQRNPCVVECTNGKTCREFGKHFCLYPKGKKGKDCKENDAVAIVIMISLKINNKKWTEELTDFSDLDTQLFVEIIIRSVDEEFKGSGVREINVTQLREGSVIADISLTFDEPVGENEVESLLLDTIKDGSLGTLKVDTFSVGSTISDLVTVPGPVPSEPAKVNKDAIYGSVIGVLAFMFAVAIILIAWKRRKREKDNRPNTVLKESRTPHVKYETSSLLVANPYGDKIGQTKCESLFAGKQNEGIELESSNGNLSTVVHHAPGNYMDLNEVRPLNDPATDPERSYLEINEYAPLHPGTRSWEVERENVTFEKIIGKGAFGQVAQGKASNLRGRKETITVAIKMLKGNATDIERKDLLSELEVLKKLRPHPHVIKLQGCVTESDPLLVLIEYVPYGDLLGYLRKSRHLEDNYFKDPDIKPQTSLTSQQLMKFSWQVADGMHYLSSKNIIHRDLAARNVLVGEQERCKVTDFGMARDVCQENIYEKKSKGRLPVKWTACEALLYGRYTTKSDVCSFGIVLYEIFTIGGSPYPKIDGRKMADLLTQGYRMPKPRHVDDTLYKIMQDCWQENPDDRPIFENLRNDLKEMENQHQRLINMQHYDNILYASMD
nr:fibroblast growth factor receptor-like [Pocillopora verrucosa]